MPIVDLPIQKSLELEKSPGKNPYVVENDCQGEGHFELDKSMLFSIAHGQHVDFLLQKEGVIKNVGRVELRVKTPGL